MTNMGGNQDRVASLVKLLLDTDWDAPSKIKAREPKKLFLNSFLDGVTSPLTTASPSGSSSKPIGFFLLWQLIKVIKAVCPSYVG